MHFFPLEKHAATANGCVSVNQKRRAEMVQLKVLLTAARRSANNLQFQA